MIYLKKNHPFVRLRVKFPRNDWRIFESLIDTGFSGGITLPRKYEELFKEEKLFETKFQLADETWVKANVVYTTVKYPGGEKDVQIVFVGDTGSLAGVEFLDQMVFCLDLKNKKSTLQS